MSLALIAPLAVFLVLFFAWPLVTMMSSAVSDPGASRNLPLTAEAIADWDGASEPSPELQAALVADLRAIEDDQIIGDLTRRLNSAKSGFRTLMSKTVSEARDSEGPVDLIAVDKRWGDPAFWQAIAAATASPYTDRNLLAAVDLMRSPTGEIVAVPEGSSANLVILQRTLVIAGGTTLACIFIGLPYAMVTASVTGWKRHALLGAVLLPLWTSLLVRTAAWFIILQDNGVINEFLQAIGLTSGPLGLLFNRSGVIIAMTHVLLPFMVLPIFSVLISIPGNLMPAAASLGAHPLRAFWRILLPLSLRGVVSGSLLVFMAAIGYYITPALIGGPTDQMMSSVIAFYAMGTANWGMAGALGIVLLVATIALFVVYDRLSSDEPGRA